MIVLRSDDSLHFGTSFNLPGPVQYVPRGKLFAIVHLLGKMSILTDVIYETDNEDLIEPFKKFLKQLIDLGVLVKHYPQQAPTDDENDLNDDDQSDA